MNIKNKFYFILLGLFYTLNPALNLMLYFKTERQVFVQSIGIYLIAIVLQMLSIEIYLEKKEKSAKIIDYSVYVLYATSIIITIGALFINVKCS